MKEVWYLGTTPSVENCACPGDDNYTQDAKLEMHVYIDQLVRIFGLNPDGTIFKRVSSTHDYGVLYDIEFHFDNDNPGHIEYALAVERGFEIWDSEAIKALKASGYSVHLFWADTQQQEATSNTLENKNTTANDQLKSKLYEDSFPSDEDPLKY